MKDVPEEQQDDTRILGDINPLPKPKRSRRSGTTDEDTFEESPDDSSTSDRTAHPGSRDVTEGTTGGTGTEVGGTRNLRTGTGATGTDIGNRPE